jgi:YfiH family protein
VTNLLPLVTSATLKGIPHGFFQSGGGAHQYGYGGEGDPADIAATRKAAAHTLVPQTPIVTPHQVHSPDVVTVTKAWADTAEGRPVGDALVTATHGITLGIVTADCGPVLFADKAAGVIGAAHAGWRGAHSGILENTVAAMEALGATRARIAAVIGPTIAQDSYEVDEGFRANFSDTDEIFFASGQRAGHLQFDLPAYIAHRLEQAGIAQVADLALDTYTLEQDYYSYRRATHRNEPNYGRHLSAIALG